MKDNLKLPKHVAIIMDGNGRWANSRSMLRMKGHEKGADTVRSIITETRKLGISCLTLYTFSLENWGRGEQEVNFLMSLLSRFLKSELGLLQENDIKFVISGDMDRLPPSTREEVEFVINETGQNKSMILNLALSYGSRQEILRAVKSIANEYKDGNISENDITQEYFSNHLYTAEMPEPDLMIRTGGEYRLSNFLLWQMAYAEFYFTPTLWPDFTLEEYHGALEKFGSRERRFGLEKSKEKRSE